MNKNLKRRAEDVAKAERELEEIENTLLLRHARGTLRQGCVSPLTDCP